MTTENEIDSCENVQDHLVDLLDGTANARVLDHLVDCDDCRDARFDAEQAADYAIAASADYQPMTDLEARVLARLDAAQAALAETLAAEPLATTTAAATTAATALATTPSPSSAVTNLREHASADTTARSPATKRASSFWIVSGVAAAAAAAVVWSAQTDDSATTASGPGWTGRVAQISQASKTGAGLQICDDDGDDCRPAIADSEIAAGSMLKTDDATRARIELADGSEVSLDRASELVLIAEGGRHAELRRGALVADIAKQEGQTANFEVPVGKVEVLGTKFSLRATDAFATASVSRGLVKLVDRADRVVTLSAGEEGQILTNAAPSATSAASLGEDIVWSEELREGPSFGPESEPLMARGLGELRAKKAGEDEERTGAVKLNSHKVSVRIAGNIARTVIEEEFTNTTGQVLEGIYRFPIPSNAQIERLALDVNGEMEDGAFVDRDRAAAIWRGAIANAAPTKPVRDEIIWVPGPWEDPALLEWQRGGRFELRIFPIPARGSRRIILSYTQVLPPSGKVRRYSYPLPHDPSASTAAGDFQVDVQVKGHDPQFGVWTHGYAMAGGIEIGGGDASDTARLTFRKEDFVPTGDLVVEYALPDDEREVTSWAYSRETNDDTQPSDADLLRNIGSSIGRIGGAPGVSADRAPFVGIALRPRLPRATENTPRDFAIVVDASRSMIGESYARALSLATRITEELDHADRFTVLACDSQCQEIPGGLRAGTADAPLAVRDFLSSISADGASDVARSIEEAVRAAGGAPGRSLRIVYIGDGTPTVGPVRPGSIIRAVERVLPAQRGRITAVAIGAEADVETLGALASAGGGVMLPYVPGQRVAETAYAVLGASYGGALRDVEVRLPAGLVEVTPHELNTIPAGGEALIMARMVGEQVSGPLVLRGKIGDQPFERTYPIEVAASSATGNAFLPRLYAAAKIGDLQRLGTAEAKSEAIRLSSRYNVASRYTSLLVLESPAMFKAFGLDNKRTVPVWSGEEESVGTAAGEMLADGLSEVGRLGGASEFDALSSSSAGPPRKPTMAPKAAAQSAPMPKQRRRSRMGADMESREESRRSTTARPRPRRRPNMVPMRRVWDRHGSVITARDIPRHASAKNLEAAIAAFESNENSRGAVKKLYSLYAVSGDIVRARDIAEFWSRKDPMDPAALTALADIAAGDGDRARAIRLLGSVIDIRPDDIASQKRLARLHRWAGREEQGCRHSIAIAELRAKDADLLAEAVYCSRSLGDNGTARALLASAEASVRTKAERAADALSRDTKLSGDLRLEAHWEGDHDIDLALIHPDGHRVSWLGAPTRSVITATDVMDRGREGLALRGAKSGEYVIQVVRASGSGPVRGTITVTVANSKRHIPFTLTGDQATVGIAKVSLQSRLVPAR